MAAPTEAAVASDTIAGRRTGRSLIRQRSSHSQTRAPQARDPASARSRASRYPRTRGETSAQARIVTNTFPLTQSAGQPPPLRMGRGPMRIATVL